MNLSKKTFWYSAIITSIIVALMIGYFVLMLPSLYVAYMENINYESIKGVQERFLEEGDYKNISSRNPTATITLKIPKDGDKIYFFNGLGSLEITIKDNDIQESISKIGVYADDFENFHKIFEGNSFEEFIERLKGKIKLDNSPFEIKVFSENSYLNFEEVANKVSVINNNTVIFQQDVTDKANYYTNYLAFSSYKGNIIITLLPVMTPQLAEIRHIIIQSLPMIIATSTLIILIATIFFSRKIINPIKKLANHAIYINENSKLDIEPIKLEGRDEIAELGDVLNDLYKALNRNFMELEEKNKFLYEQNIRQEVFLRASSHQLKTPIAASLLLLESMINEIGKYKDTREYLPKVKEQVISMKEIIDSILNLNKGTNEINIDSVDLKELIENTINYHNIQIEEKEIDITLNIGNELINSDRELIYKVIDNLINNAIKYTPNGQKIEVTSNKEYMSIVNHGCKISKEILPHIFDPFVSSSSKEKGHGLGLYIVAYYCRILNLRVEIKNIKSGVEAKIYFS